MFVSVSKFRSLALLFDSLLCPLFESSPLCELLSPLAGCNHLVGRRPLVVSGDDLNGAM